MCHGYFSIVQIQISTWLYIIEPCCLTTAIARLNKTYVIYDKTAQTIEWFTALQSSSFGHYNKCCNYITIRSAQKLDSTAMIVNVAHALLQIYQHVDSLFGGVSLRKFGLYVHTVSMYMKPYINFMKETWGNLFINKYLKAALHCQAPHSYISRGTVVPCI